MTPQDLIAAFDTLAEAPTATSRLREMVLELAVRGNLVAQDASDEPAGTLLERITEKKARLIKAKTIRKPKPLPPISDAPFELPPAWRWARIGEVSTEMTYGTSAKSKKTGQVPVLRMGNIQGGEIDWTDLKYTDDEAEIEKYRLPSNTVLFNRTNSPALVGKTAIYRGERAAIYAGYLIRIGLTEDTSPDFVNRVLGSPFARAWCWETKTDGVSQSNISASKLALFTLPVPPLAEQKRIVVRVDELMGLLDKLEEAQTKRNTTRVALRDSSLAALQDANSREEVQAAWKRVVENIDDLINDPGDVEPLRQTVLQLAMRGRLVPQDPSDEPAAVQFEFAGRRPKWLTPVSQEDFPGRCPSGWQYARLAAVATLKSGIAPPKTVVKSLGGVPYVRVSDMNLEENATSITRHRLWSPTAMSCVGTSFRKGRSSFQNEAGLSPPTRKGWWESLYRG